MKKYAGSIVLLGAIVFIIIGTIMIKKNDQMTNGVIVNDLPVVTESTPDTSSTQNGNGTVVVPVQAGTSASVSVTKPTSIPESQKKPGTFTLAQVATHATESNCYSAINGVVYDLTAWINKHPGGSREILRICGKDGSSAFNGQHGGDAKPERILAGFEVGVLN